MDNDIHTKTIELFKANKIIDSTLHYHTGVDFLPFYTSYSVFSYLFVNTEMLIPGMTVSFARPLTLIGKRTSTRLLVPSGKGTLAW
jgi:uncharacterized protein YqhQ